MGKLFMLVIILASVGVALWAVYIVVKPQPKASPDRVLPDDVILASARENLADLVESQRVLSAILEDDEDFAFLKERRRREAQAIVTKYNQR